MKILQINNQHYIKGGAHRIYLDTASLFKNKGHEVYFFSMKSDNSILYEKDKFFPIEIDYRNTSIIQKFKSIHKFIYNIYAAKKLKIFLEEVKPDIAHVHLFMGGLTTSILKVLKDKNIPIIHSVHDYRLICPSYIFLDGQSKICERCKTGSYIHCVINKCSENNLIQSSILAMDSYYRKYVVKPDKFIDKYLFVSRFTYNKHLEFKYTDKSKSVIIHNFIPNLDQIIPSYKRGRYFLYLGRLSREKGVITLINAAEDANVYIKIVGGGPLMDNNKICSNVNIEFLGYKSGKELWEIIQEASFIIVPSEWYENNPLSIIEAYAYGKPVIGSNIGGIPEIIENEKTGFLFENGNKEQLKKLLIVANMLSEEKYLIMAKNARNFAETHFSDNNYYNKLLKVYQEIIKKNKIK